MSGYFFSPSFPGYYLDDVFCTWHITVPSDYVIHLEFQEFRLKDHSKCGNCFLQIFDGKDETAPTTGRFCGYVYPPVLVSSSNHFTIVLQCGGNLHKARFKAFYYSVGGMCCFFLLGCNSVTFVRLIKQNKTDNWSHRRNDQQTLKPKFEASTKAIGPSASHLSEEYWNSLVLCF